MSLKDRVGMIPLMVGTRSMGRRKGPETVQRTLEYAFTVLFLGLAAWHLKLGDGRLWSVVYLFAAVLSVVPARTLLMLWITGMAATGFAISCFVTAGIADQNPSFHFGRDPVALALAAVWFGTVFVRELRGNGRHQEQMVNATGADFINLRNLHR